MIKSNRGQLSIFMGVCLILIMGMLAFIINVGLFVKAKINLQNAVDAAAFSGAATQSRQLTNMAYVNWEMRNTYKEWMFKYYVLGQLSLAARNFQHNDPCSKPDSVNFYLNSPDKSLTGTNTNASHDQFNLPSICIHNKNTTDICPLFTLPGIPRFPAIGAAGISEIHEAYVNKLVQDKAKDCSSRTKINYLAALSWAYSSGINPIPGAPEIAVDRPGAWLQAIELAFRMRNLEMVANRPPVADMNIGTIGNLMSQGNQIAFNERPIKAFMSAFRNLSGGKYKDAITDGSGVTDEFASTFTLTELKPQPFDAKRAPLSSFLIPDGSYPDGMDFTQKHYVDLEAMPVNLSTFYSTFVPDTKNLSGLPSEAACLASKTALPVPGYLLGFTKNPKVLTYYAVKGEAEFTGLFFPRSSNGDARSIKLTAYAAAKPFGGRIGPRLFDIDGDALKPRRDKDGRSVAYVSSINFGTSNMGNTYQPGMPIPSSSDFWVSNTPSSYLGGVPTNGSVNFGIPNLIFDADSYSDLQKQSSGGQDTIQEIKPRPAGICAENHYGLHSTLQMSKFKGILDAITGGDYSNIDTEELKAILVGSRQATKYDAANYLIPEINNATKSSGDSNIAPLIQSIGSVGSKSSASYYNLYAPLMGDGLLYTNISTIETLAKIYTTNNRPAIDAFLKALYNVAYGITQLQGVGNGTDLIASAQSIHSMVDPTKADAPYIPPFLVGNDPDAPTCKQDLASKMYHFFAGTNTQCGIVPLEVMITSYINKQNNGQYYQTTYQNDLSPEEYMSAYYPGYRQGATVSGEAENPLKISGFADYSVRRNFYSTKFVPLHKLFRSTSPTQNYSIGTLRESAEGGQRAPIDLTGNVILNALDQNENDITGNYFTDL